MEVSGQLHALVVLSSSKLAPVQTEEEGGGSQSLAKPFGADSNLEPLPRIEPRFLDLPALTLATVAMRPL